MGNGGNFTENDPWSSDADPFDLWLLCGSNGSCTDLTPMAMILGGGTERGELSYPVSNPNNITYKKHESQSHHYASAPVCVWPPFMWVVSNSTTDLELNCTESPCFYTLCCGLVFLLWLICRLKAQTQRDKVVIAQALVALEQGAAPDIWLSMLKN